MSGKLEVGEGERRREKGFWLRQDGVFAAVLWRYFLGGEVSLGKGFWLEDKGRPVWRDLFELGGRVLGEKMTLERK